jgi:hypothetical protein
MLMLLWLNLGRKIAPSIDQPGTSKTSGVLEKVAEKGWFGVALTIGAPRVTSYRVGPLLVSLHDTRILY